MTLTRSLRKYLLSSLAVLLLVSIPVGDIIGEWCFRTAKMTTFNVNVGGPWTTKITGQVISYDTCKNTMTIRMTGEYSNASRRYTVSIGIPVVPLQVYMYDTTFIDYQVQNANVSVTQYVYDATGKKLGSRVRTGTAFLNVRVFNNSAKIMGGGGVRIEEERLKDGFYWDPFIGEFWFR